MTDATNDLTVIADPPRPAAVVHRDLAAALEDFEAKAATSHVAKESADTAAKIVAGFRSELAALESNGEGIFAELRAWR